MHTTLSKKDFSRYLPFLLLVMTVFRVLAGLRIPYMIAMMTGCCSRMLTIC